MNQLNIMFRKAKYTADITSKYEITVSCIHITRGKKRNTYKLLFDVYMSNVEKEELLINMRSVLFSKQSYK